MENKINKRKINHSKVDSSQNLKLKIGTVLFTLLPSFALGEANWVAPDECTKTSCPVCEGGQIEIVPSNHSKSDYKILADLITEDLIDLFSDTNELAPYTPTKEISPEEFENSNGELTYETPVQSRQMRDCKQQKVTILCSDDLPPGAAASSCINAGNPMECTIQVPKTHCEIIGLPSTGISGSASSIENQLNIILQSPDLSLGGIDIITTILHELVHCNDGCKNPRMQGCLTEKNAYRKQAALLWKIIQSQGCQNPNSTREICRGLWKLYRGALGGLKFNECVCNSSPLSNEACKDPNNKNSCVYKCKKEKWDISDPKMCEELGELYCSPDNR